MTWTQEWLIPLSQVGKAAAGKGLRSGKFGADLASLGDGMRGMKMIV